MDHGRGVQRKLTRIMHEAAQRRVLLKYPAAIDRALLLSGSTAEAASSASGMHTNRPARLDDDAFEQTVWHACGFNVFPTDAGECPSCGQTCSGSVAHATVCRTYQKLRTTAHTLLDKAASSVFGDKALYSVQKIEGVPQYAAYAAPRTSPAEGTKADVAVRVGDVTHLIDFTICGPAQAAIGDAATRPGAMAERAEARKRNEFNKSFSLPAEGKVALVPFAMECTGSFGSSALRFVGRIMAQLRDGDGEPLPRSTVARKTWWAKDKLVAAATRQRAHDRVLPARGQGAPDLDGLSRVPARCISRRPKARGSVTGGSSKARSS